MKTLIIIPTYNELENLPKLLPSVLSKDKSINILIVDDNSPDGTAAFVENEMKSNDRIHLLKRSSKQGLGTAYIAGFKYALENGFDLIFEMDADFSHDPNEIPKFLDEIKNSDLVLGFWIMIVGFNLTFGPMHVLGLGGMIRRSATYPEALGLTTWNQVATIGSGLIAVAVLIFLVNAVASFRKAKGLENEDPWDARTLEWTTSCPPPDHNFDEIPVVTSVDEFWHRKYAVDREGRWIRVPAGAASGHDEGHDGGHGIHLPSPSFWPLVSAIGLPIVGYGVIYSWWLVGAGALVVLIGLYGWAMEPSVAE